MKLEPGQRVAIVVDWFGEVARGRIYKTSPNERFAWVKFTLNGETRTEEWDMSHLRVVK